MAEPRSTSARLAAPIVVVLSAFVLSAAAGHAQRVAVKAVHISQEGDVAVVTIEADGPLPAPTVGEVDGPPRFFLDFAGVNAATKGTAGRGDEAVVRVRVALHSTEPRITRVVLDLSRKQPIRTEAGDRAAGRFTVLVGAAAPGADPVPTPIVEPARPERKPSPPRPGATAAPPAGPPASTAGSSPPPPPTSSAPAREAAPPPQIFPTRPPAEPLPERDVERYRGQVEDPLNQLTRLRPLLMAIDRRDPQPPAGLREAREELSGVLRALTAVRPPDTIRSLHDLLLRSASFALMSATLRDDAGLRADPEKLKNAASAAAGALLLLDRVCQDIGCGTGKRSP